jgi:7,8-dihydropterin-6-yl-methyl-4-(beta-D-ribofuranosyl)aminobenzene 5'-phosphate synthase
MSNEAMPYGRLREVDSVELIVLADNVIDRLSTVPRDDVSRDWWDEDDGQGDGESTDWRDIPLAEHGFSALVRIRIGAERHTLLFDAGTTGHIVLHNARLIGLDWEEVEAIALSHGHFDHTGGLPLVLEAMGRRELPIVVHEHMFARHGARNKEGAIRATPAALTVTREQMTAHGAHLITNRETVDLFDGALLVTGEIPRQTTFEDAPHPQLVRKEGDEWVSDPWVWDDRSLALAVRGEGLVVISGCAHAGIVNTVLHARAITGCERVRAIIGGFHLAGKRFEPRIAPTVEAVRALGPELIIPMHCTGPLGAQAFVAAMPDAAVTGGVLMRVRIGQWDD